MRLSRTRAFEGPTRTDYAVAAAVAVSTVGGLTAAAAGEHGVDVTALLVARIVLALLAGILMIWRRRWPLPALVVATAADPLVGGVGGFGPAVGYYTVARELPSRLAVASGVLVTAVVMSGTAAAGRAGEVLSVALTSAIPLAIGLIAARRQRRVDALEARADWFEAHAALGAAEAVSDERARIARELHDVVAHHVSLMVVQAGAAQRLVEPAPADALAALRAIETSGRGALVDLRHMLMTLRDTEARGGELAPQPTLAALPELVEQFARSGVPVDVVAMPAIADAAAVPQAVSLSGYRIVQEALTNVLKHAGAGARAAVTVACEDGRVQISVTDSGSGATSAVTGSGLGLIGLSERVAVFGGDFRAGPRSAGGFGVEATLPYAATEAT